MLRELHLFRGEAKANGTRFLNSVKNLCSLLEAFQVPA